MPSRLAFAFLSSLLLHLGVLGSIDSLSSRRHRPSPTPAMLEALLLPAPKPEPLLKDTLSEKAEPVSPGPKPATDPRGRKSATAAAQRKLAEHLFYPPEAISRGLEGEVRLLLTLSPDGTVTDAAVAGSSGHAILDQAALRAAYAMASLPGSGRREIILPVVFRLRP